MTDRNAIGRLRVPDVDNPLRILVSACLTGMACGYDGSTYGSYPAVLQLLQYPTAKLVKFCPEDFAFGTPREMCDIHGGTGLDVLQGKARVLTESGRDWTKEMICAAAQMLKIAQEAEIEIAVLMDMSAACGSQVISSGNRFDADRKYQAGMGVCAALLRQNGFLVISQRDFASLELLYTKLDIHHQPDTSKVDHHETTWYKEYFGP